MDSLEDKKVEEAVAELSRLDKKTKREKFDYNKTNIKDKDEDVLINEKDIQKAVEEMARKEAFVIESVDVFPNDEIPGEFFLMLHSYTIAKGKHIQLGMPSDKQGQWRQAAVQRAVVQLHQMTIDAEVEELF